MIPTEVMTIIATIGLTPDQAVQVARAFTLIETATEAAARRDIEARRANDRERKERQRHGKSRDSTGQDVTGRDSPKVAPRARVLNLEEEVIIPQPKTTSSSTPKGVERRGTRISQDWVPSEAHKRESEKLGLYQSELDEISAEHLNYWLSESGVRARKLDWERTFLNRLRDQAPRYLKRRNGANNGQSRNGQGSLVDAGLALIRRIDDAEQRRDAPEARGWPRHEDVVLLPRIGGYGP